MPKYQGGRITSFADADFFVLSNDVKYVRAVFLQVIDLRLTRTIGRIALENTISSAAHASIAYKCSRKYVYGWQMHMCTLKGEKTIATSCQLMAYSIPPSAWIIATNPFDGSFCDVNMRHSQTHYRLYDPRASMRPHTGRSMSELCRTAWTEFRLSRTL